MKYFIPANFDVDKLIRENPPTKIRKFSKDKLLYILHLITSIPATNKDLELYKGFVPIHSTTLQKKINNYREYLNYLITCEVLITDNWYVKGQKSKGYQFTTQYRGRTKTVDAEERSLIAVIIGERTLSLSMRKKYNHLVKWYTSELKIDRELAEQYTSRDYERKLENPELRDYDEKQKRYIDPAAQYNSAMLNVERIAQADFKLSVDTNVFRLHSTISNLRSELRNCITWKGHQLVSIDIKNSQPYLSTVLLNPAFWSRDEQNSVSNTILNINSISKSITKTIFQTQGRRDSFIMLLKWAATQASSDVQRYSTLVRQGTFYEYFEEQIGTEIGIGYGDRRKVKAAVFQVLFTDNRYIAQEGARPKRLFKEIFPTVYTLFSKIKQSDKTYLPRLLQRIESHLMLRVVSKRVARERPKLPIFTIHDSIITTTGNENYVKGVLLEEMEKAIGFPPKTSIEYWHPSNLKFRNGDLFYGDEPIAV